MSFFRYFANLNGQYIENGRSDFQYLFFKCAEFNFESSYVFRFSISLIVFSQNAKNGFSDLATMKLAKLRNSDVMEKTGAGFGLSEPKFYENHWFCFRKKKFS